MCIVRKITDHLNIPEKEAELILEKACTGGEISPAVSEEDWFENRFKPNTVLIDEEGYAKMCVDALKILGKTAATDFGGSRQRDLGQLWADMTRGYLGEYAFQLFLKRNYGLETMLGHDVGELTSYLPQDIHYVKDSEGKYREPRIKIGIKTSKWNGIWLDIAGDQFNHSDIHVFIKVGTGRDHLFAFFKKISVFRDKVLEKGKNVGAITNDEAEGIFSRLPDFAEIPAYICGFVKKDSHYNDLPYEGKRGRINYNITAWNGSIKTGDIERIRQREHITGRIKFEGIGDFAHDSGYLFNTGNLLWKDTDWQSVISRI